MCAILGYYFNKSKITKNTFKEMLEYMKNRGKDYTGFYFNKNIYLGHNRLSIRDIENGNQPMIYENLIIVYNGEIYNTDELKKDIENKGIKINTKCDTEIIIKGYYLYKEKILDKLEGIFAFCIYDNTKNKIFLARDRFGIKPLFFFKEKNNFIFSSMIKPIFISKLIDPILTKKEIKELLAFGPSKKVGSGIFHKIKELEPAHYMIVKNNKIIKKRYWKLKSKKINDSYDTAKNKVRFLVEESIKSQMISDEEVGCLLSGGLDSSIITSIVSNNLHKNLDTYSIDYEYNKQSFIKNDFTVDNDNKYIDIMAKRFNTNHKRIEITQKDLIKYLDLSLEKREYPGMADIDSSLLYLSKQIVKDHKVILSGECADEIFGGYPWFYRKDLFKNKLFPWINNIDYRQNLINKNLKISLKKELKKEYKKTIRQLNIIDRFNKSKKLFYINMTHFMTTLLDRKDRMTMGVTLEARVPFANTKLIEYLWNLPFDYKYRNNEEKYILKDAFKDMLPKEIINRKKNPYPKTHSEIYLNNVINLLKERLNKKDSKLYLIFDIDEINILLDSEKDLPIPWFGQLMRKAELISYLYMFDLWIEKFNIEIKI